MTLNEKKQKVIELKAQAYDAILSQQTAQNILKVCNTQIAALQKEIKEDERKATAAS